MKIHIKENPEAFGRFGAQWTPTIVIMDDQQKERHRIEGFLPADDFLAEISLGLARSAFERGEYADAEKRYRGIVDNYGTTSSAAEALYWSGVSRYKATNDANALGETAEALTRKYRDSVWAKKSQVWLPAEVAR